MLAVGPRMLVSATGTGANPGICLSLEHVALCRRFGSIEQPAVHLQSRRFGHLRLVDMARSQDVKHALSGRKEIVGNDAPVTAPPHRLRAHDGAALRMACLAQAREPLMK